MMSPGDTKDARLFFLLWGSTGVGKSSFIKSCGATVTVKDKQTEKSVELQPLIGRNMDSCKLSICKFRASTIKY